MCGPKSSKTLTVASLSVESTKYQQVPPRVLVCFCCCFGVFFRSRLHSISAQLPIGIEKGGDGRAAGQGTHSSTLCRQKAMQILSGSLNP